MNRAFFELVLAAAIWGFAFIAVIWALPILDPVSLTIVRFLLAFLVGLTVFLALSPRHQLSLHRSHLMMTMGPGVFLGLTLVFQSWGLEGTSVTNSGFITTLYVVFIPLFELVLFKKRIPRMHFLWVLVALVGTAILTGFSFNNLFAGGSLGGMGKGDFLTLICALFATVQIIWVGKVSSKIQSPFLFNVYQCFWAGIAALFVFPFYGAAYFHSPSWLGLFALAFLILASSLYAFYLQAKAQQVLSPSVSSLIFLLESPFAVVFAFFILSEPLTPTKMLGASLVFLAAIRSR